MKRRLILTVGSAVAIGACNDQAPTSNTEAPSTPSFVLYGQPDGNSHPYVGFSIFFDPSVPGWFRCSGALLEDRQTFLSAGHCTFGISTNGKPDKDGSGGRDIWVTFDEHIDLTGFPPSSAGPAARRAWLNDNPNFTRGTAIPHPEFDNFAEFPSTFDVGVVKLDAAVSLAGYAELAEPNGVTDLDRHQVFDIVGYGLQDVQPMQVANLDRMQGQTKLVQVKSGHGFFGPYNLQLSSNNGAPHRGATCFGDSGGPVLVGNVAYAVNSYVWNSNCTNASYAFRVDLPEINEWVLDQ
jgi:Trypsin